MKKLTILLTMALLVGLFVGCHSSTATQQPTKDPKEEMREEAKTALGFWSPGMSSQDGIELKYIVEDPVLKDADVTFHIRVNCGEFYGDKSLDKYKENPEDYFGTMKSRFLGDDFVIENGETVSWCVFPSEHDWNGTINSDGGVFAEAVIWADGHVIGYRLIQIRLHPDHYDLFYAKELAYEYYPKVDGTYPSITEADVRQEMEKHKAAAINKNENGGTQ